MPQPLLESGLDSLGAIEVRNALAARTAIDLSTTAVFDYPSITALASYLTQEQQRLWPEAGSQGANQVADRTNALHMLQDMVHRIVGTSVDLDQVGLI